VKTPEGLPLSRLVLGLASLVAVLVMLVLQVDTVSPGPLATTHGREPELAERGGCVRCHGEGAVDMADSCAECHGLVLEQIHGSTGFHGHLEGLDARDCAACHNEHSGSDFPLVSARSFRLAGFATREDYDHEELDFLLQGRHAALRCAECHENADTLLVPRGAARFTGLDQGCQSCHEDAHEGRIARACADCHGQEHPFSLVASFAHDGFESTCAHAAVSCRTCHEPGGAHDAELLAGAHPPDCARACASCHLSPHGEAFLAAADVLAGTPEGGGCAACHSEAHGAFRGHLEATAPAVHAASGFALDPPHAAVACERCHAELVGDEARFGVHVPARTQDDCRVCHGDPHGGEFERGPFAGAGCLDCHARTVFAPSGFGPEQHARTEFPLVASHEAVACLRCHGTPEGGALRNFEGLSTACAECHGDAHRGAFDVFENPEGCARCHEPTLFADFLPEGFDHGEWTDTVLDGAHARAECTSCHRPSPHADENGRTFGFVAEVFPGPVERCETCHADVHEGRFEAPGMEAVVDGRVGCARCHTTETFAEPRGGRFDHERWTGYPMADFHARVECRECHVPSRVPDANGRSFGRAEKRCQDCHEDPHVAQFALEGVTDCARCHQDAGGLAFDHQRDSRFALDETHAALDCAVCHVPWPLPGGGSAVRYKPLGTECVDCHDPEFLERAERTPARRKKGSGFSLRGGQR